jgi:hypothetical protein
MIGLLEDTHNDDEAGQEDTCQRRRAALNEGSAQ